MSTKTTEVICAELVTRVIDQITYHPDVRKVWPVAVGRSWTIKIQMHRADTPRVVGERGAHIKALDLLTIAIGNKGRVNMRAQLIEPEVGLPDRHAKFKPADNWNSANVLKLAQDICEAVFLGPTKVSLQDGADYNSTLEILVSRSENRMVVDTLADALKVLFNAIGKANGRILFLDVLQMDDAGKAM